VRAFESSNHTLTCLFDPLVLDDLDENGGERKRGIYRDVVGGGLDSESQGIGSIEFDHFQ